MTGVYQKMPESVSEESCDLMWFAHLSLFIANLQSIECLAHAALRLFTLWFKGSASVSSPHLCRTVLTGLSWLYHHWLSALRHCASAEVWKGGGTNTVPEWATCWCHLMPWSCCIEARLFGNFQQLSTVQAPTRISTKKTQAAKRRSK